MRSAPTRRLSLHCCCFPRARDTPPCSGYPLSLLSHTLASSSATFQFYMGDDDHIKHATDLFLDFKIVFSRVLMILGMSNDD